MGRTTLYHFCGSHYNEKVRWALDWKRVPHERRWLWPGPHIPRLQWLSGQAQTPVLQTGDRMIVGSAAIIDHLEQAFPDRLLYPKDPADRERALAIQRRFDEQVGAPTNPGATWVRETFRRYRHEAA